MFIDSENYYDSNPMDDVLYDAARTLAEERAAGVGALIWMPQPKLRPENEAMARALVGFPERERFTLTCSVNPQFGVQAVVELERCATQWGMKGLKLMPTLHGYSLTSPTVQALMEKARELKLVVNIHSGSFNCHPLQIAALARRYPEVPFVMDHMGYRYDCADALTAARECPNIYLGTALVSPAEPILVKRAAQQVGAERVVFGSNAPGSYIDLSIEGIRRQSLGPAAEEMILGGTQRGYTGSEADGIEVVRRSQSS